jgi:pimeloyl-ACP methyl ester carboxylesterase
MSSTASPSRERTTETSSDRRATNDSRYLRIFGPVARPRPGRHLGLGLTAALVATAAIATSAAAAPAPKLDWQFCAQPGFQCAPASVPRDYSHPNRAKVHLAVIRHRATDPAHRIGTLFYNPGGPGESGVLGLPGGYRSFPPAVRARFDLVSWDPRGVGSSTAVRCFATKEDEDRFLDGVARPGQSFPVGKSKKKRWIRRYRAFGRRCGQEAGGGLLRHVSTADTARDMNLLRRAVGDRRLSYWGTSYGSFLGATYANLFPSRVRALVLDGNVNPRSYAHRRLGANGGSFLSTFLRQHSDQGAARTLDAFLNHCGRTDTARCAFSAGSAAATREKYDDLLQSLRADPASADISYADLTSLNLAFLGDLAVWREAAKCLQGVWANGRSCGISPPPTRAEQQLAILCSESPNPAPSAFRALDAFADQRSGASGPAKSWASEPCGSWPATAADRYTGPWGRRTANPVLVIGNTHDPNTPYRSSLAMAGQLARARLLTVDGYGHTELNNPSACANRHASRYLIAKTLPPQGTKCKQDRKPFMRLGDKP